MTRFLAVALFVVLLAGCMGDGRQPVELTPVDADLPERGRPASNSGTASPPDCAAETVQAAFSQIARIQCKSGTGSIDVTLKGCASSEEPSWLMLETKEGRLASGNATATVASGRDVLATLRVDASAEDGKETMLAANGDYQLTLDLDAWSGEWVVASVECPA